MLRIYVDDEDHAFVVTKSQLATIDSGRDAIVYESEDLIIATSCSNAFFNDIEPEILERLEVVSK